MHALLITFQSGGVDKGNNNCLGGRDNIMKQFNTANLFGFLRFQKSRGCLHYWFFYYRKLSRQSITYDVSVCVGLDLLMDIRTLLALPHFAQSMYHISNYLP